MAYEKIQRTILNPSDLAANIKDFMQKHTSFSFEGDSAANQFSYSRNGYFYNLNITNENIWGNITREKPKGIIQETMNTHSASVQAKTTSLCCSDIKFPIVSAHFITDDKLVVFVLEIQAGIFIHHAFGKMNTYDIDGGEFNGGTRITMQRDHSVSRFETPSDRVYYSPNAFSAGIYTYSAYTNIQSSYIRKDNVFIPTYIIASIPTEFCTVKNSFYFRTGNNYNSRLALYPLLWFIAEHNGRDDTIVPAYHTDFVMYCGMGDMNAGDMVNNEYVIFPQLSKHPNGVYRSVEMAGIAYKV